MSDRDYYKRGEGKDRFGVYDDNDHYLHRGTAQYNEDGSLKRWDNISPVSGEQGKHHHEWIDKNGKYDHGVHDDHKSTR